MERDAIISVSFKLNIRSLLFGSLDSLIIIDSMLNLRSKIENSKLKLSTSMLLLCLFRKDIIIFSTQLRSFFESNKLFYSLRAKFFFSILNNFFSAIQNF